MLVQSADRVAMPDLDPLGGASGGCGNGRFLCLLRVVSTTFFFGILPHSFSVIGTVAGKTTSLILSFQVAVKEMKIQSATNLNKHCHEKNLDWFKKC